tara:strand:- start:21 stop:500 length:480 start_codon:yes stop_codon:yes gene_type:complete
MKIIKQLTINKPIEDVWEVLGNQFGAIDIWASLIEKSEMSGESKFPGISNSIRSTETTSGPTKQELTAFNPTEHVIAYKAIAGTPGFFKSVHAEWSLVKKDDNTTGLKLDFEVKFKGLGVLLTPVVKLKLGKVGDVLLDDFQFYVENEKPHARKLALAK